MPSTSTQPPLNPTVEEVEEESAAKKGHGGSNENSKPFSWPELSAQHERMLSSHLEMLNAVRGNVVMDGDTFRMVSSMVEKTNKLVTQFKVLKKQIMSNQPMFGGSTNSFTEGAKGVYSTSTSSNHTPNRAADTNSRRKRARRETNGLELESESTDHMSKAVIRTQKRKRLDVTIPGDDEDVRHATPVSAETEDISEEVQRRLEIKEEQRRKRSSNATKEKRKRESLESVGSSSSLVGVSKPRKRARVGMDIDQDVTVPWEDRGRKRQDGNTDEGMKAVSGEKREVKRRK
ncbi:hypothetical protein BJX96DRAFT_141957 [Aspergillus floccosus]